MGELSQMALTLPFQRAFGRSDFCVSMCNSEAVNWIERWPDWPFHCVLIYGDAGCGKTHLGHIFSDFHVVARDLGVLDYTSFPQKIVVEGIDDGVDETALFHLYNFAMETGRFLILTARRVPVFQLPDLQSRMQAVVKVKINVPDDALLLALLQKGFTERSVLVGADVLEYIVKNSERSFSAIQHFLTVADQLSLEQKRKITIPLAREILAQIAAAKKA